MTTQQRSQREPAIARIKALFVWRRIVISLVLAAGLGAVVIGFLESADPVPKQARPVAIIRVFPTEGSQARLQETVGFQLGDDFVGELRIDGQDIPLDQLVRSNPNNPDLVRAGLAGLGQVSFTPGVGKIITRLFPGEHHVTAIYRPVHANNTDADAYYDWTFIAT